MLISVLNMLPMACVGVLAIVCGVIWWRKRNPPRDPYDLKLLFEEPRLPVGEAYDDMVTAESGPYCVSCDEPYPAGTSICHRCGRQLG